MHKTSYHSVKTPLTVVFILSSPRSGSTWLNLVLGSCSWAMNLGEYKRPWIDGSSVICRLCEARGLPECTLLHGYKTVVREDAFHFAASRSGKSILIDCSKDLGWCESFLAQDHVQFRLVHLVRHPCGFIESELRRRSDRSAIDLLDEWDAQNRAISDFLQTTKAPSIRVSYDQLADQSGESFPELCSFIGGSWENEALEYWKVPHHCLGGNGAASAYLRGHKAQPFLTGDDHFYEGITARPTRADVRFRDRLPLDLRQHVLSRPSVKMWNDSFGVVWRP